MEWGGGGGIFPGGCATGHSLTLGSFFSLSSGIVYGTGECWRQLRRFAITTFKNFGMGKRSIEERIKEEAQFLMAEFHKTQGWAGGQGGVCSTEVPPPGCRFPIQEAHLGTRYSCSP